MKRFQVGQWVSGSVVIHRIQNCLLTEHQILITYHQEQRHAFALPLITITTFLRKSFKAHHIPEGLFFEFLCAKEFDQEA